ncbi:MAG: hypothetical protein KDI01_00860 [Halioglobus sp.]|nr:hypothetical protein [Halioglobus sp.]
MIFLSIRPKRRAPTDGINLGLLTHIANFIQARFHHKTALVSTNANLNHILTTMGFYDVFNIDDHPLQENIEGKELPAMKGSDRETADTNLPAHRMLAALNKDNLDIFNSVVAAPLICSTCHQRVQ